MIPTLNPMDGCPHCKWISERGETRLDEPCALHVAISDLQESLAIERDVRRSQDNLIKEICEAVGAGEDDDPAAIVKSRMEELKMLEDLACINCGEQPKSGNGSRAPDHCTQCAAQL